MKFGINLSSALPKPWGLGDEEQLVHDCQRAGVLADQLGFDYFWVGEHHFLEEYHHISACEVLMGALAVSTKTIRLAHGIMTLQPQMNHPVRATFDDLAAPAEPQAAAVGQRVAERHRQAPCRGLARVADAIGHDDEAAGECAAHLVPFFFKFAKPEGPTAASRR